jgi:hypothetical protein
VLLLLGSSLALGFLHGLGADHLMAIAALSLTGGRPAARRTFAIAVRFALGHAGLLALGASGVVLLGWTIPVLLERAGELAGGAILIALGAAGLWLAVTRRIYAHTHEHGTTPHLHWHVHLGRRDRHPQPLGHTHVPGVIGAVFAISGLRALALMLPVGGQSAVVLFPAIGFFAVGILASMSLFGIVLARALGSVGTATVSRVAGLTTSAAAVGLGVYWVLR